MVEWLRFQASNAGAIELFRELRSHMPQHQKKKKYIYIYYTLYIYVYIYIYIYTHTYIHTHTHIYIMCDMAKKTIYKYIYNIYIHICLYGL